MTDMRALALLELVAHAVGEPRAHRRRPVAPASSGSIGAVGFSTAARAISSACPRVMPGSPPAM